MISPITPSIARQITAIIILFWIILKIQREKLLRMVNNEQFEYKQSCPSEKLLPSWVCTRAFRMSKCNIICRISRRVPHHRESVGMVASCRVTQLRIERLTFWQGDIVLCSCARHFTLTVPLSTQVYKWVPTNLMLGVTLQRTTSYPEGNTNIPSCFMLQKAE